MLPPISFLANPKKILREKMSAERRAGARADAGVHSARNFMDNIDVTSGMVVSVYYPLKDELDTWPLVEALIEHGADIALPVVERKKQPLVFRRYAPGDPLKTGAYDVSEPAADAPAVRPDIVVAPLLAFTREGGRLGYGGGYYDRTLEALRAEGPVIAVGYAYGLQEVDALPLTPLDQPLDWVVTEREAIRC